MLRKQNIRNLKTEKAGISILRNLVEGFIVPSKDEKKILYEILNIDYKKYFNSIDGVILNVNDINSITSKDDFTLVEIKTTSSRTVKELPYGVFFGFTKNEEDLFKRVDNYRLCIVHTLLNEYVLLTYEDYKSLIQNKRIQYQVNFKSKNSSLGK